MQAYTDPRSPRLSIPIDVTAALPFSSARSGSAPGPLSARPPSTGMDEEDLAALLARYGGEVTELLPWLLLSGAAPATDVATLRARRVSVVVNLAGEVVANAPPPPEGGGPAHLTFSLRDGNFEDIFSLFPLVCTAVEAARAAGGVALLHCWQGVSRSASCAIAYVMWAGGLPYAAAYDFVRRCRPIVSPNPGFTCQLVEWGAHLGALFGCAAPARPRPPPLLLRLRRLAAGCSRAGALLGAPVGAGSPLTHALGLCRREEDRALLRAGRDAAAAQAPLEAGEALLAVTWCEPARARVSLLLPQGADAREAAAAAEEALVGWRALAEKPAGLAEAVVGAVGGGSGGGGDGGAPGSDPVTAWELSEVSAAPGSGAFWARFERVPSSFLTCAAPPLGDRDKMVALYLADVRAAGAASAPLPEKAPGTLRVAQWNLNVLAGPDFKSPVPPAAAASALAALGADVLLLQEACQQSFPAAPPFSTGVFGALDPAATNARLRELHSLLAAQGYVVLPSEAPGCFNPPLLATRLPVLHAPPAVVMDAPHGPLREELERRGGELRACRAVTLDAGGGASLCAVSAHLHHRGDGALAGARAAEVAALLAHAAAAGSTATAVVVAGDFNGARVGDYPAPEAQQLARSLAAVAQPAHDGVPEAMEAAGFRATYDAPAAGGAPGFTHWSGATVDYAWVKGRVGVEAVRVLFSALSDHLPIVTDLRVAAN